MAIAREVLDPGYFSEELALDPSREAIILIGNIGSGKTTIFEPLGSAYDLYSIASDELFLSLPEADRKKYLKSLEILNNKKYSNDSELAENQKNIFDFELNLFNKRVDLISRQMSDAKMEGKIPFIDFGLIGSWTYLRSHINNGRITREQWEEFDFMFNQITSDSFRNTTLIYIQVPPEICRQRVEKRAHIDPSREYELDDYTIDGYLSPMHMALEEFIRMYGANFNNLIVFNNVNHDLRRSEDQAGFIGELASRRNR